MRKLFQILISCSVSAVAYAQTDVPPFWEEIQAFKRDDSLQPPPKQAILLVGSSSFRKWTDVQETFPGYRIINRSFGGSAFPDVIRYADDVIFKYDPKQVVVYCGDNDLASGDTVTADTVYRRFVTLFTMVRAQLPKASVVFVSIKPSPARAHLMPKVKRANTLIKNYLKSKSRTAFVDVYRPMLQPDGQPKPGLFVEDSLHMNSKGYEIWKRQLKPVLLK
jgi:lysophospholipase L1-like esterase